MNKHADCRYFTDGCGNGLNDLIGTVKDPVGSVVKTVKQSADGAGVGWGWGIVGWASQGPAGVLQSGVDGYMEFGVGQLGLSKGELAGSKGEWGGGTFQNAKDPVLLVGPWIQALGKSSEELSEQAGKVFAGMVEMVAWELGIGAAKTAVSVLRSLPRLAEVSSAVIRAGEVLETPAATLSTGGAAARAGFTRAQQLANAVQTFRNGPLTIVGRALTKHPNVIGESGNVIQKLGGAAKVNEAAAGALENIMQNGTMATKATTAFGEVVEYKLGNGIGARFSAETGEFISFLGRGL